MNIGDYAGLIDHLTEDMGENKYNLLREVTSELSFINKYVSKEKLKGELLNSDEEIIREANTKSPVILVIGEPLVGKTRAAKLLAEKLDMLYLSPEKLMLELMAKADKFQEILEEYLTSYPEPDDKDNDNKDDPDQPKEERPPKPNIKDYMDLMEYKIYTNIINGGGLEGELYIETIKYLLASPLAHSRGVIIDQVSSLDETSFAEKLLVDKVYGDVKIDYVVELASTEEEIEHRISQLKYSLKHNELLSTRDIELIKRPKKEKKLTFDDEPIEEEEPEEPILDDDLPDEIKEQLPKKEDLIMIDGFWEDYKMQKRQYFEVQYVLFKELIAKLGQKYYVRQDVVGHDVDMIVDNLKTKLNLVTNRPVPKIIEEGGSFKDVLTTGREGLTPPRRWSQWKQVDPVALKDNHVIIQGLAEFTVDYCGRVFCFINEENRNSFFKNAKFYLKEKPKVPEKYRVAIFGPSKSGKKTIANYLSRKYGWKLQNIEEAYSDLLKRQKSEEVTPNCEYNFPHFSVEEWNEITRKKKTVDFYSKIVFWLYSIGIPLEMKRTKDEMMEFKKYHENKLYHLLNPPIRKKKEKPIPEEKEVEEKEGDEKEGEENEIEEKEDQIEENEIEEKEDLTEYESYDDPFPHEEEFEIKEIKSTQFYFAYDENLNYPRPGGFIFIHFPLQEEEVKQLALFGIKIDKVIHISCNAEEESDPLRPLAIRYNENFDELDDSHKETLLNKVKDDIAKYEELFGLMKTACGENLTDDDVIEVNTADKIDVIQKKLDLAIDPFITLVDDDDKIVTATEIEETAVPFPKGEFGDLCPVTLKKESWLFYGLSDFECSVNNRKYKFANEDFLKEFQENVSNFLSADLSPISLPPPHLAITGYQKAGVSTLANYISKLYKFKNTNLKDSFTSIWEREVEERKILRIEKKRAELEAEQKERLDNKKDDDNVELLDIEELLKDDALKEESDDYNATENDKKIFKGLFLPESPTVYDSSWYELDEKIATDFFEMMYESRKTPNVFVIVNVKLETILKRFYSEDLIKKEREELEQIWLERKKVKIAKLRAEREAEIEEKRKTVDDPDEDLGIYPFSEEEEQVVMDEDEEDNPRPADLYIMLETEKSAMIKRYQDNQEYLEKLKADLTSKNVPFVEISNDFSLSRVHQKLVYLLNSYIVNRRNLVEKQLTFSKFEELTKRKMYELNNSQIVKSSIYQSSSPVNPEVSVQQTAYPVIYRDKIYFFNNIDEQREFLEHPLDYRQGKEIPADCHLRKVIFVIGLMQTGKKTAAKVLEGLGYTVVNFKDTVLPVLDYLIDCPTKQRICDFLYNNRELEDDLIIRILEKRLEMKDLANKNIVLYDLPFTLNQVHLLESSRIVPDLVFVCEASDEIILERVKSAGTFKRVDTIVHERLLNQKSQITDIVSGYKRTNINLFFINSEKSKWFNSDLISDIVGKKRRAEASAYRQLCMGEPISVFPLLPKSILNHITASYDRIRLFSPVSLKSNNEFVYSKYSKHVVMYNNAFFFLKNEDEVQEFIKNVKVYENYLESLRFTLKPPIIYKFEDASKFIFGEYQLEYQGCCPITIKKTEQMVEGNLAYSCEYKNKYFVFVDAKALAEFVATPDKFMRMKHPIKTLFEKDKAEEEQVNYENTVEYLESYIGSLVTKGLLKLSNNRIKYPYLSVKETSIKFLALFLKAYNPINDDYSARKYGQKLADFIRYSKLPFELLEVFENYQKCEEDKVKKALIRKQLNYLAIKYDKLMEKAKIQKNNRFDNFFRD